MTSIDRTPAIGSAQHSGAPFIGSAQHSGAPTDDARRHPIKTALLSVFDKRGLLELAQGLLACGVRLISTGGTAQALRDAGLPVTEVADKTGFPEILDGRVKTLHPLVHGGLLGRATAAHEAQMAAHGIEPIDLLAVNLYPFAETIARRDVTPEQAIEQIDIGGPAMIRSASKNHERVTVLTDPAEYQAILAEISDHGGTSADTRLRLSRQAFAMTAAYDQAIADYLTELAGVADPSESDSLPQRLVLNLHRQQPLRYGENPHQRAALYRAPWTCRVSLPAAQVLQGKELSYNNLVDLDAALALVLELPGPAAAIVKHTNPCGAAIDQENVLLAYQAALVGDPVSAFGGIVAVNRPVQQDLAHELCATFLECVIAPGFSAEAVAVLRKKPNLRVLIYKDEGGAQQRELALRSVAGGVLVQTLDSSADEALAARPVTRRTPSDEERRTLDFAWRVAKHVKSNAIVLCRGSAVGALLVGVGAGQMSRVDSVKLAVAKAGDRATGSVLASDAFFPFRDGIDAAAAAGVVAAIQPGGSVRDAEVITAADEHGIAMLWTGARHFRH